VPTKEQGSLQGPPSNILVCCNTLIVNREKVHNSKDASLITFLVSSVFIDTFSYRLHRECSSSALPDNNVVLVGIALLQHQHFLHCLLSFFSRADGKSRLEGTSAAAPFLALFYALAHVLGEGFEVTDPYFGLAFVDLVVFRFAATFGADTFLRIFRNVADTVIIIKVQGFHLFQIS